MSAATKPASGLWESPFVTRLVPAFLLLVLVAVLAWRSWGRLPSLWQAGSAASPEELAANVKAVAVQRGEVSKLLRLDGELRAVRSRTIFADMPDEAKITWMPDEGTLVQAGDRLAELDSTAVLAKIKDAEEKLIAAENEILRLTAQQEGQLRDFQVELSRFWLAFEKAKVEARLPADVVPRREYQEKQFTLDKARTEYETQQAKIEQKKREFTAE